jgi:hypothetical protein
MQVHIVNTSTFSKYKYTYYQLSKQQHNKNTHIPTRTLYQTRYIKTTIVQDTHQIK